MEVLGLFSFSGRRVGLDLGDGSDGFKVSKLKNWKKRTFAEYSM